MADYAKFLGRKQARVEKPGRIVTAADINQITSELVAQMRRVREAVA